MASKVIIVTGASRGIGLAIAQHLIKESHKVVLAARSKDQLEALKAAHPGQVEYVAGDLGDLKVRLRHGSDKDWKLTMNADNPKDRRGGSQGLWQD